MKLQIQSDHLRLRIDEAELAALLAGERLHLCPTFHRRHLLELSVSLGDGFAFAATGSTWMVQLDRARVQAHAATLPTRDALSCPFAGGLRLDFDVDARDSARVRRGQRRIGAGEAATG
ncbi:MAG: hypothetical protein JSR34_04385 [Proteobacteria bacterium]|nr:hypothetical protein [Pseudomonadota bacterium]